MNERDLDSQLLADRGRVGGRKPSLSEDDIKQMKILLADPELTVGAVAKRFNVSRMTIYRYTTKGNHSEKINDEYFEVPTFVKAHYSYAKVEARFVGKLYQYMMTHKK